MYQVHRQVAGLSLFFFQAEDGIRYLVRSRGLGDVYKRQPQASWPVDVCDVMVLHGAVPAVGGGSRWLNWLSLCLLYTSDAADERSSVDLGGPRIL